MLRGFISRVIWNAVIRRLARARGFPDPAALLSQINRFAQPAEVLVPTELIRLGLLLQARGLLNAQAFQHNLDWVWPYWVEQQFKPRSPSFIPRAFSVTHINLTHRNWTAIGLPGSTHLPIVDPRGLVTPFFEGWSLDGWMIPDEGDPLLPSRAPTCEQHLHFPTAERLWTDAPEPLRSGFNSEDQGADELALTTVLHEKDVRLMTSAAVTVNQGVPTCSVRFEGSAANPGWLVIALRPCNPEGLSLVHDITVDADGGWTVNKDQVVRWNSRPDACLFSCYHDADVFDQIARRRTNESPHAVHCPVGMATSAALFRLTPESAREVRVDVPLERQPAGATVDAGALWSRALSGAATAQVPDRRAAFLFDSALVTLILHTPGDVYAGPYTYKRFWFRDAVQIAHALMCAGLLDRARAILDAFPQRLDHSGYFQSQRGEWDSNGQVLWAYARYCELSGTAPDRAWIEPIAHGAEWIVRKRVRDTPGSPHQGLMPAGFSAEHFGTNDFYYWDDFWSISGLRGASDMLRAVGRSADAERLENEARDLLASVERSLESVRGRIHSDAMPASPYRRLDSAAVGSLAAGYPLQIWSGDDPRLVATAAYLRHHHVLKGALFHDIAHSGLNPYLTLHVAQVLMRAGEPAWQQLVPGVAALASPTGKWPEAVHPALGTGCMGDGEHAWAAAEWVMLVRNAFVREEGSRLVLCSGVLPEWRETERVQFGPTPTRFGPASITIHQSGDGMTVAWSADWREPPTDIEVALPGLRPVRVDAASTEVRVTRDRAAF